MKKAHTKVRLSEVIADARPGFASGEHDPGGTIQLRMNNVGTDGSLNWDKVRRVPATARQLEAYNLKPNDVVLNATNSPELVGKTTLFTGHDEEVLYSNHFLRLRTNSKQLYPPYLARWLTDQWRRKTFLGLCNQWVNQASVRKDDLLHLKIPLPPLSEQKRIADILDKADAIRRKRQEAADLARRIEDAWFAEMFLRDGNEACQQKLGELCTVIRDGVHKTPVYVADGIPFVTVKNLTAEPNGISFAHCKFISHSDHADFSKRTNPAIGDILVSKDGTIGVAREVTGGLPFNIFVSVALLKPKRDIIHPTFLKTQFNMPFVQRQILDEIKGVAIRHLHLRDFKTLSIIVPDMATQMEFVDRIRRVHLSEESHAEAIRETEDLFNSLVQRAFKGEL